MSVFVAENGVALLAGGGIGFARSPVRLRPRLFIFIAVLAGL